MIIKKLKDKIMNADNLLNILLFVKDIKTISSIYQSCKFNHDTHELSHFWIQKYKHDNLPVMTIKNTFNEWLKDYDTLLKKQDYITHILSHDEVYINNNDIQLEIHQLPFQLKNAMHHFTPLYKHFDSLRIRKWDDDYINISTCRQIFTPDFFISHKYMHEILLRLYYNHPDMKFKISI